MSDPIEQLMTPRLKSVLMTAVDGEDEMTFGTRRIVDVGSDHGHLAIYALLKYGFGRAVLTDIHAAPAKRSEEALRMYGLSDRSEVFLTDGLDNISLQKGDIVVMAGLGGNNMIDIMNRVLESQSHDLLKEITWCLQPQKSLDKLRGFLFDNGFRIKDENVTEDRGMSYLVLRAAYEGIVTEYTLLNKYYGPVVIEKAKQGNPDVLAYIKRLDRRYEISKQGNEEVRAMLTQRYEEGL